MIEENLSTLKIHKLTEAQYDKARLSGTIDPNALYLTPNFQDILVIVNAKRKDQNTYTADYTAYDVYSMIEYEDKLPVLKIYGVLFTCASANEDKALFTNIQINGNTISQITATIDNSYNCVITYNNLVV